jgi:RNA polymerase sigma-70 factor, ECF subfamily
MWMPRKVLLPRLDSQRRASAESSTSQWLGRVYREHARAIFRYLLARTHSVDRAEDLTQEVFLGALAASQRLQRDDRPLRPWLYAVARHRYAEDLRRRHTERTLLPLEAAASVAGSEPDHGLNTAALVKDALQSLPPSQRRICVMRLFEGRTFAEIREEVEASEPACRMQFARGLRRLRGTLERAGLQV